MPFQKNDIITFCGETFLVIENHGNSGKVAECDNEGACNDTIIQPFYWTFQGTQCEQIGHRI